VPVARNQADVGALKKALDILRRGETLVVYPEGTRNTGSDLLPFKAGAFMIALLSGASVVPVGMVGTNTVLAKGQWLPRTGRISVQIGAPMSPPPPGKEPMRLRAMAEAASRKIEQLVESAGAVRLSDPRPTPFDISSIFHERLTRSLDDDGKLPREEVFFLEELVRCARQYMRDDTDMLVMQTRLDGLRAEHRSLAMQAITALRIRWKCERILAREAEHALANYIMGRWHLKAPALLGADKLRALDFLHTAVKHAPPGDTRFRAALAEAWLEIGLPSNARREMERVIVETPKDHPRYAVRVGRAQKVLTELSAAEQGEISR